MFIETDGDGKMGGNIKTMTEGKPLKLIFSFALPLMIGNVFQQLYTVVDTMVVGQVLGVNALAALGASDWLNWMMLSVIQGFAQGFSILMAQEFGAGHERRLRKVVGNAIGLSAVCAAVLLVFGEVIIYPVLELLQTPDAIIGQSALYLRIMFAGIPVVMAYNLLASILRALGDGKAPLHAMIVAAVINIVLDLLFVIGFRWGIAGAAAATVIAQFSSSIYCYMHIRKIKVLSLAREDFLWEKDLDWKLIVLGLPMAFQNAIISVGGMIVQTVVNGFGVIFIAGFTATNKLYGVLEVAATSYGYAMITYAGQNLGAGKIDRIKKGMKSALFTAIITAAMIAACMLSFGRGILRCFISGTPEEVEMTMTIAYHYLAVMSICLPILYILHVVRSTLQGMGDTLLPMVSGIVEFIMRTGTAVLLPIAIGEEGIFYAEILAWMGADVILVSSYWVRMKKLEYRNGGNEN